MGRTYPSEIQRILYLPGGDVGKAVRKCALLIAAEARLTAERQYGKHPGDKPRTGALSQAYRVEVVPGTNQFRVRNPKKYAAAMELGAKPHIIAARKVDYLQFQDRSGRSRRVKLVRHPGSVARNTLLISARVVMRRHYGVS